MSILPMMRSRTEAQQRQQLPQDIPYAPRPKPAPPGPHQLGNITLQALDQITEKCAQEYDKAAEQLEEAARERADGLRECARRMRATGLLAQEKVSNFVKVMVTSADVSVLTQQSIAECDAPAPQPAPETPPAGEDREQTPAATADHLAKVEAAVAEVISQSGAADAP